jgi:ABC-type antimicrobial peptide transport system permease subunit
MMVMRESMGLVAAGLLAGLTAALWSGKLVAAQMYGVEPEDPATLLGAILFLLTVAMLASWIPARRAATLDPLVALRNE